MKLKDFFKSLTTNDYLFIGNIVADVLCIVLSAIFARLDLIAFTIAVFVWQFLYYVAQKNVLKGRENLLKLNNAYEEYVKDTKTQLAAANQKIKLAETKAKKTTTKKATKKDAE